MEVVVPAVVADFIFDSTSTTPYVSAPSSPRSIGEWPTDRGYYYTSAPTSPTRAAAIYREFNVAMAGSPRPSSHRSSVIPFEWEDVPRMPKSPSANKGEEVAGGDEDGEDEVEDFDFEFSGQLQTGGSSPLTADELFEEGMIRPLKPPPRLQFVPPMAGDKSSASSPRSPKSPKSRFFRRREKDNDFDPFVRAMEEATRGRDRANPATSAMGGAGRASRRAARSLSPLRGGFDSGNKSSSSSATAQGAAAGPAGGTSPAPGGGAAARWVNWGSKKWRLKDLLLFRSASEGRATGGAGRDPLRKYTALSPSSTAMLSRKGSAASLSSAAGEDTKNASFRSTDSGSVGGSSRRGVTGGAAAHGRHYAAAGRAAAEEMRRKTMLPYRQGLFGCLGFNPAINGLARGFSSSSRSRP